MGIVLGPNQYGKAEVRVVAVDRSTPRHALKDLTVSTALRGDFAAAHLRGDNAHVLATDTQKNTVFAFARDGIGEIEDFGLRLARHLAGAAEAADGTGSLGGARGQREGVGSVGRGGHKRQRMLAKRRLPTPGAG